MSVTRTCCQATEHRVTPTRNTWSNSLESAYKFHGDIDQGWLILSNGETKIGLFQGMFEKNMLTFNPGWTSDAQPLESFTDVRDIQKQVKADGIDCVTEADETTSGPASFMILDPDGNPVLIDQHV